MTQRDPSDSASTTAQNAAKARRGGGKLGAKVLSRANLAILVGEIFLFWFVLKVHLGFLGDVEMWLKFFLIFVIVFGPSLLIDYLKNGNYF